MKLMPWSSASFTIRFVSSWPRLPMFIWPPNCMLPSATSLTIRPVCPSVLCLTSSPPCTATDRLRPLCICRRQPCSPTANRRKPHLRDGRDDGREIEIRGAMLGGFVQPGAIRPGLFQIAAPGGSGFHDEPQVFRGMPQFEGGGELTRLDVGSLGPHHRSDGRVGEGVEQHIALEPERLPERKGFSQGHNRRAQRQVGHEFHGGSRSPASPMPP